MTNVEKAVRALGIEWEDTTGAEHTALCPMHFKRTGKEDRNPSWSINAETGQHLCWSCGYKGGLLRLVADVNGFVKIWGESEVPDYEQAKRWLLTAAAMTPEDMEAALQKANRRVQYEPPVPMSEARLAVFVDPPEEALKRRRLTLSACQMYEVLWEPKKEWWITPLRDVIDGKLIGWQEKSEFAEDRYFKNRPPTMKKSLTLFGYNVLYVLEDLSRVIVVESPLDAVRVYCATGIPAVATCGAHVSEAQIQLLRNVEEIIWAMDNPMIDMAGRKACHMLLDMGKHYGLNAKFFNYEGTVMKDPGEMKDADIQDAVENAIHAIHGRKAYLYV